MAKEQTFRQRYDAADDAGKAAMRIGSLPVEFRNPTVSVVIPCLNEGADLETTVAMLCSGSKRPTEIIVVDNGSKEPAAPRLEVFNRYVPIRVIRNETNIGSGRGKSQGLDSAMGDLLIVMDSHMRPRWDFIQIASDAFVQYPYSFFCPICVGFAHLPPGSGVGPLSHQTTFCGRGARFYPHKHGYWEMRWNYRPVAPATEPAHCSTVPCILGGCYIFGREAMHHIGGYNRNHKFWGYEQEFVSIRAWVSGMDCRLLNTPMPHHFTEKNKPNDRQDATGAKMPDWGYIWHNIHFAMRTCFEDGRFEKVMGPMMKRHYWKDGLRREVEGSLPAIARMRKHIASIRLRSDSEVAAIVGMRHPETVPEWEQWWSVNGWKDEKKGAV